MKITSKERIEIDEIKEEIEIKLGDKLIGRYWQILNDYLTKRLNKREFDSKILKVLEGANLNDNSTLLTNRKVKLHNKLLLSIIKNARIGTTNKMDQMFNNKDISILPNINKKERKLVEYTNEETPLTHEIMDKHFNFVNYSKPHKEILIEKISGFSERQDLPEESMISNRLSLIIEENGISKVSQKSINLVSCSIEFYLKNIIQNLIILKNEKKIKNEFSDDNKDNDEINHNIKNNDENNHNIKNNDANNQNIKNNFENNFINLKDLMYLLELKPNLFSDFQKIKEKIILSNWDLFH
jgi:hypothetical protein